MSLNRTFRIGRCIWTLFVTWYFMNFSRNFFNSFVPHISKIPIGFFLLLVVWMAIEYYFSSPFLQSGIVPVANFLKIIFAIFFYANTVYCIADYSHYHWTQITLFYPFFNVIGIAVFTVGILLRFWTLFDLLRNHTQKFPKSGIFNICRHPRYLATILQTLSIPLIFSSYLGFIFSLVIGLLIIKFEIDAEEKTFIEKFGEEYITYRHNVPQIIPKFSRLTTLNKTYKQKNKLFKR